MNQFSTILSVLFLFAAVYFYALSMFRNSRKIKHGFRFIVFLFVFFFAFHKISDYFTGHGITDAVIYHLMYGLDGAGFSEYWFLAIAAVSLILATVLLLLKILNYRPAFCSKNPFFLFLPFLLLLTAFYLHPALHDFYKMLSVKTEAGYFSDYYRKPFIVQKHHNNKNLVFVYLEGVERTYFDETIFPELVMNIRQLEQKSTYFNNIGQNVMHSTMAGLVASQCGIPLVTYSHGNSMGGMDKFLPAAVCLGDLLNEKGYYLAYMGGADLAFAGKGKFFKTHQFDEVLGYHELLPELKDPSHKTGWGITDDALLDLAYDRFSELSKKGDKFGLFLLTLDTHPPNGYPSKSCQGYQYGDGSNPMLNAVACSDRLVGEFAHKIINSPWADNTIIVLASDHLGLRSSSTNLLKRGNRKNLFMIIDPTKEKERKIYAQGSTLDIGTTLLSFLGYEGAIGLGRDIFSETSKQDIIDIKKYIHAWNKPAARFWKFPKLENSIKIDATDRTLTIDDRVFEYPILVEINKKDETILKFQFSSFFENKRIVNHLYSLGRDKSFIAIDYCDNLQMIDKSEDDEGFCLMMGYGRRYSKKMKIKHDLIFSIEEIHKIFKAPGIEFHKYTGPNRWAT